MTGPIPTAAGIIILACRRIMPASRREWADAMLHEFDHIPASERLAFAIGCLKSSVLERLHSMFTSRDILFLPALAGSALLALLCLINGFRLGSEDGAVGAVLILLAAVWSATYLAFLFRSKVNAIRAALTGLIVYTAIGLASWSALPGFATNAAYFEAVAAEGIFLFLTTLTLVMLPILWPRQPTG